MKSVLLLRPTTLRNKNQQTLLPVYKTNFFIDIADLFSSRCSLFRTESFVSRPDATTEVSTPEQTL